MKIIKKTALLIVLAQTFLVKISLAADFDKPEHTDFGEVTSLEQYVGLIYSWARLIIYALSILMIVVAGYRYITSTGNPEQAEKAKKVIITAVTSFVLVTLAAFIIHAINPNINTSFIPQ